MINRHSGIVIVLLFCSITFVNSQTFRHPYSNQGIGISAENNFAHYLSMGGFSLSYKDSLTFSPSNPASYSNLITKHNYYSTFDAGFQGKYYNLKQDTHTFNGNLLSFAYFSLGFPLYQKIKWAGSFGLLPVSRIGYNDNFDTLILPDSIRILESILNNGGFSKFYIGSSFQPLKFLNIGFNAYYLFGNNKTYHTFLYSNNAKYMGITSTRNRSYGNFGFDLGTQIDIPFKTNFHLLMGGYFSTPVKLKVKQENLLVTFLNETSSIKYKDTVINDNDVLEDMTIPLKYGASLAFSNPGHWIAGLEYNFQKWSSMELNDNSINLNDFHEFIFGAEFKPEHDQSSSYLKRMSYRVGIKYAISQQKVPFDLNESPMNYVNLYKRSLSFGTSLPVKRSISVINTGIEAGLIGKAEADLIREFYINFYLGFRLNDIWFKQSKID